MGRIVARSAQLATTDFPSLVVSLSMLAAPYREVATFGDSPEPAAPADFVLAEEETTVEDEFVVDGNGEATEVTLEGVEEEEVLGFAAGATNESGDLLDEDVALFASSATDNSGDLLDEHPTSMSVPMPEPPTTDFQAGTVFSGAVPASTLSDAAPTVATAGEPIYRPDRSSEHQVVEDADLQPVMPHGDPDGAEEEEQKPTLDPNIAAIVFPKTPATTEAPVPSVVGFDPSRYFNFDDSGVVEDNLEVGSEFGVPQRAANSPEALKALKELSAFRDR